MDDQNEVLYSGHYTIANKPVIVKAWSPQFNFNNKVLKVVSIWIQVTNLPLNSWSMVFLNRIGSAIGIPLFANDCTRSQT